MRATANSNRKRLHADDSELEPEESLEHKLKRRLTAGLHALYEVLHHFKAAFGGTEFEDVLLAHIPYIVRGPLSVLVQAL